jgi:transcriptional regulator GlxA family with amidase domain
MPRKFVFILLPEVHLLDLAGPDQVISEAIDMGADFELVYCGTQEALTTSAGLHLNALKPFDQVVLSPGDYVLVPGSRVKFIQGMRRAPYEALYQWLREQEHMGVCLVSICVGAFILGKAGLLDGKNCTTHFQLTRQLQEEFPKAKVQENVLFTQDGMLYTSAGIASGIDLLLHILEAITDGHFAYKVARELVVYARRGGEDQQLNAYLDFRQHMHQGIHKAQDFILEHLHEGITIQRVAEVALMSERNFTRLFKKETGITVKAYLKKIRLEQLKSLLNNPDLSRKQMALKLGLTSEKQLARLLKEIG